MRKAWAITVLTLRNAARSRLIAAPAFLLLFITVVLPFTLKGDGTPDGLVRLTIGYTLGLVQFTLAVTAIWTGCSAVAADLSERPLYLVLTKPVHPLSIWLGKWLGLSLVFGLLLGGSAIGALGMLNHSLARMGLSTEERRALNEEVLISRTPVAPAADADFAREARERYAAAVRADEIPAGLSEEEALSGIREALIVQANRVEAEQQRMWHFQLTPTLRGAPFYYLRYTVMAPGLDALATEGRWEALDAQGKVLDEQKVTQTRGIAVSLRLPGDICPPDGTIRLRYTNTDSQQNTVIFPPQSAPELLCRTGTFAGNYLRVVLIQWIQLLFWTAIGVTAGCFFSQPVAVIFTGWLVLLTSIGAYLQSLSAEYGVFSGDPSHRVLNLLGGPLYWALHQLVRPLETAPVMDMLLRGEQITWSSVGRELGIRLLLYSGMLALLGAFTLKRREVGLPVKAS